MNIIDLIIIILIIGGLILGFMRGFTKEIVCFAKLIFSLIIAFIFKNPLSKLMYMHLPFFQFGGIFKGVSAINIILYELIAFLLVFGIVMLVFRILIIATTIFEKILSATIILGIPSKILGMIIGGIHYLTISFIFVFVASLPITKMGNLINDSKLGQFVLNNTPILSSISSKTVDIIGDFNDLGEKYKTEKDTNKFNLECIDLLLKYDIITVDSVETLNSKNKLKIKDLDTVIKKYGED